MEKAIVKKVLITDDVHPLLIAGLEEVGYVCDFRPNITLTEVHEVIEPYEGLIINSKILVDKVLLNKARRLKFVGRLGSGMEIIDRGYAAALGVGVFNSPEGNRNAVAEHALGMLLGLLNHLCRSDAQVRRKEWHREANRGFELMGRTVGIVGFGHTGSQFASKLAGLGVRVVAYDKYKPSGYAAAFPFVEEVEMEAIFETAEVVSLHLPLTPETRHLVDGAWLERFKNRIILINTSRGKVVKTEDLVARLEEGGLWGACLDVFENEQPATFTEAEMGLYERLYALENVMVTPHVAGWTVESKEKLASILLNRIVNFLKL